MEIENLAENENLENDILDIQDEEQDNSSIEDESIPNDEIEQDIVTIEGSPSSSSDEAEEDNNQSATFHDLRKRLKEATKRNKELEEENSKFKPKENDILPSKPNIEDFNYDYQAYESAMDDFYNKKIIYDQKQKQKQSEIENQQKAWNDKQNNYRQLQSELKVKDFEDAESFVTEYFDKMQQGIVLQGADNPAVLVYALGKNPKITKDLSAIKDPVQFAFAIAKLETKLKVNKNSPPPPEKMVTGDKSTNSISNSQLEKLRLEANRSGDYTKVVAYKKQLKNKR